MSTFEEIKKRTLRNIKEARLILGICTCGGRLEKCVSGYFCPWCYEKYPTKINFKHK